MARAAVKFRIKTRLAHEGVRDKPIWTRAEAVLFLCCHLDSDSFPTARARMTRKIDQFVGSSLERSAAEQASRTQAEEDRRDRYAPALGKRTLYRYRSLQDEDRDYAIDIIANHRVYLSSPDKFNDPFDLAPRFALSGNPNDPELVEALLRHQEQLAGKLSKDERDRLLTSPRVAVETLASEIEKAIRATMIRSTRVLCLSGERLHPLSWAHYASSHTGICLHFSTRPGSIFSGARKVLYQEAREPIVLDGKPPAADTFDKIALTKAKFWEYEDEYRVVTTRDGQTPDVFDAQGCVGFPPEALCGITLGMLIGDGDRHEMLWHAAHASPTIPVWQARMHSTDFWMTEDRIA